MQCEEKQSHRAKVPRWLMKFIWEQVQEQLNNQRIFLALLEPMAPLHENTAFRSIGNQE